MRSCTIKQNSLLFHKTPYIHPSIFKLSDEEQFNWSFEDMASKMFSINENNVVFLEKSFRLIPSEPGDGRQSKLYNIKKAKKTVILEQCWNFSIAETKDNVFVFQCMTGIAANEFINTTYAYQLNSKKMVFEKSHCRNAKTVDANKLECEEEAVNEYGELTLTKSSFKIK